MHTLLKTGILGAALAFGSTAHADDAAVAAWQEDRSTGLDAAMVELSAFKWIARPIVIFADSPLDPAFQTQMDLLRDRIDEVIERDIVILTDTAPDTPSSLRTTLRPKGFMLALIGKDGTVKMRKPFPTTMRELGRTIDKMPMRQREIAERRALRGPKSLATPVNE